MKRVTKITTMAVVALLVVTGWAIAQSANPEQKPAPAEQPMAPPCHEMGMPGMKMMNMPELTDVQREQIQSLRIKHLKEVMPLETEIKIKRIELATLWQATKFDAKQIIAKVKEIGELRNKLELARVNHQIEIYNLLTPEQRKSFRPGMGMGMGRGMMRGRCGMGRRARQHHFGEGPDGPGAMPCCPQR